MTAQNPKRVALITGVTGQDGAYLAEYLLGQATPSTASSGGRPHSTPRGLIISTKTGTPAMCRSCCITAT